MSVRARRLLTGPAPALALFTLLRLPSFWEPHWYTDEAGYAATARAVLDGRPLYSGIWTNKPPLQIAVVAIPVLAGNASEVALHLLTLATGGMAVLAAWWTAHRLLGPGRALVAALSVAALLGSPLLDAELSVPESLLVAPASWGGGLLLVWLEERRRHDDASAGSLRRPVVAGLLLAAAACFQQTAAADAAALGLVAVLHPAGGGRALRAFGGAFAAATLAWLVPVLALAGPGTAAYALGGFYLSHVTTRQGLALSAAAALPSSPGAVLAHVGPPLAAVLLLAAGAVLCRRLPHPGWALALWAGATLVVPAESQAPYAHFLTPAMVPVALLLVSLPAPRLRGRRGDIPALRVTSLGVAALAAGVLIAGVGARTAGLDWAPGSAPLDSSLSRDLSAYYGGALRVLAGRQSLGEWQTTFDRRVDGDAAATAWVDGHGLHGHSGVVWSSDAWPYLLAGMPVRMPTAPIYNDFVLLGIDGQVAGRVAELDPEVVITTDDALHDFPEITPLLERRYRRVFYASPDTVWVRRD